MTDVWGEIRIIQNVKERTADLLQEYPCNYVGPKTQADLTQILIYAENKP